MSTLTMARDALKSLLKKREKIEATAEETRMLEHLQRRNELREELQAEQREVEREQREYEANLAALHAMGEKHSRAELDSNAELCSELLRLSKLVNNRRSQFTSRSTEEQLIESCLDSELQEKNRIAFANLENAKRELQEAKQRETKTWEAMAEAQRDILETLGSVSNQFGREGQRWRKIEDANGVSVVSAGAPQDGAVHPQNIEFINGNLSRPNRVIREGRAKDFGIERLTAEIAELTKQLAAVHQLMINSTI